MARPKKTAGDVRISATTNLLPAILDEIDHLALAMDRSRSYLIEKFTMRGLVAYRRDGLLDEQAENVHLPQEARVEPITGSSAKKQAS